MDKLLCKEGGAAAVAHARWPLSRRASPSCEQERCVNFCLVPLSPSSSKWSTSTAGKERERGRGGEGERGREGESLPEVGAGRWAAGVGQHLTQTPFVLWAGAHITVKVCVFGGRGDGLG